MADRFPIERSLDFSQLQDWLQLGGKQQLAVPLVVVERLDPQAIAGKQNPPPAGIPDREGEHPPQAIDAARSDVLVEMNDRFRVAGSLERVAAALEIASKLL